MLQLVPGDRDQNGLLRPPGRSTHLAVPVAPGCGVAHSDGPFLQEWAVASRRMHDPPEDHLDWGRLQVPVVFPPKRDSGARRRHLLDVVSCDADPSFDTPQGRGRAARRADVL